MKIDVVIIPKYPDETDEAYHARRESMLAEVRRLNGRGPPVHTEVIPSAALTAVPPSVSVKL